MIKSFPGRGVDAHLKATGKLPGETPPSADTPAGLRWWAMHCENYGGLARAFNEAANAIESAQSALEEILKDGPVSLAQRIAREALAARHK